MNADGNAVVYPFVLINFLLYNKTGCRVTVVHGIQIVRWLSNVLLYLEKFRAVSHFKSLVRMPLKSWHYFFVIIKMGKLGFGSIKSAQVVSFKTRFKCSFKINWCIRPAHYHRSHLRKSWTLVTVSSLIQIYQIWRTILFHRK